MTLVSRRFPNFRAGLPREREGTERRLERVLLRLFNDSRFDKEPRRELGALIRGLRRDLATLRSLRQPGGGSGMPLLCQPRAIPQDHAVARR